MKENGWEFRTKASRCGPAYGLHHAYARACGHDRFDRKLDRRALGSAALTNWEFSFEQLMGLWPGRAAERAHEPFCMTVLGLKLSRRAQRREASLHGLREPANVGPSVALAGGGGDSHRPHHQRRAHRKLARLADEAVVRPYFPVDWPTRIGEPEVWQRMHDMDPGELWETHYNLKNLLLAFVRRRVSRQWSPPRRERRGRGSSSYDTRSEHSHHWFCPAVRHLQTGRPDRQQHGPPGGNGERSGPAAANQFSPARPIRPTSPASSSSSGSPTCGTTSDSPAALPSWKITISTSAGI